ncbi:ferredoxin family 2Fe-2S iron-sulfur cluster binding protein [soil metagenome]
MIRVRFISADGEIVHDLQGNDGDRLLDLGQADGQPLEGTCEGQMACSTCHVIVDAADFARLDPATEMEEDMLDLAAHATRTSRLSCQIFLDNSLDGLTVRIPSESRNMQGR